MTTKSRAYLDLGVGLNLSGRVVFEFFNDASEKLIENFKAFCLGEGTTSVRGRIKKLSYEGCSVFKVMKGEYIQCGDFVNNDGTGGGSIYGDYFKDYPSNRVHSQAGLLTVVNMRNAGVPDSENIKDNRYGSQFCILLGKVPRFDRNNVVIGRVIEGMEFVRAIENVPVDSKLRPKVEVGVLSCGSFQVTLKNWNQVTKQKQVLDSLMSSLEPQNEEKEEFEDTGIRCVYTGRINKRRLPNEASATTLGKKLLTEALQGISHHYVPQEIEEFDYGDVSSKMEEADKDEVYESEFLEGGEVKFVGVPDKEDQVSSSEVGNEDKEVPEELEEEDEITSRLKKLSEKMNECSRLNNREIILEQKIRKNPKAELYISKANTNSDSERRDVDKEISQNLTKELNMSAKVVDQINKIEKIKSKNKTFGWNVFNQDALYRAHKKRLKETGFNPDLYEKQKTEMGEAFYKPSLVRYEASEACKDIVVRNVEKQYKKREEFSRRRLYDDDAQDISYINERNRVFNKKLERSFGAYSKEIKQNLERGTAL